MTTTLQPAGAALESLEAAGRHVALLVAEIERKNALLRQALDALGSEPIALVPNGNGVSPIIRREILAAISAITKELTP